MLQDGEGQKTSANTQPVGGDPFEESNNLFTRVA